MFDHTGILRTSRKLKIRPVIDPMSGQAPVSGNQSTAKWHLGLLI